MSSNLQSTRTETETAVVHWPAARAPIPVLESPAPHITTVVQPHSEKSDDTSASMRPANPSGEAGGHVALTRSTGRARDHNDSAMIGPAQLAAG